MQDDPSTPVNTKLGDLGSDGSLHQCFVLSNLQSDFDNPYGRITAIVTDEVWSYST